MRPKPYGLAFFARGDTNVSRKESMMKKLMAMLLALSFASPLLLTACNTIGGAGADIESAGRSIKNEANEHKRY